MAVIVDVDTLYIVGRAVKCITLKDKIEVIAKKIGVPLRDFSQDYDNLFFQTENIIAPACLIIQRDYGEIRRALKKVKVLVRRKGFDYERSVSDVRKAIIKKPIRREGIYNNNFIEALREALEYERVNIERCIQVRKIARRLGYAEEELSKDLDDIEKVIVPKHFVIRLDKVSQVPQTVTARWWGQKVSQMVTLAKLLEKELRRHDGKSKIDFSFPAGFALCGLSLYAFLLHHRKAHYIQDIDVNATDDKIRKNLDVVKKFLNRDLRFEDRFATSIMRAFREVLGKEKATLKISFLMGNILYGRPYRKRGIGSNELLSEIRKAWGIAFTDEVIEHIVRKKNEAKSPDKDFDIFKYLPTVLIQRETPAIVSGYLATVNPAYNDWEARVINIDQGNPDWEVFSPKHIDADRIEVNTITGKIKEFTAKGRKKTILGKNLRRRLLAVALKFEEYFRQSLLIEFVAGKSKQGKRTILYIQSITPLMTFGEIRPATVRSRILKDSIVFCDETQTLQFSVEFLSKRVDLERVKDSRMYGQSQVILMGLEPSVASERLKIDIRDNKLLISMPYQIKVGMFKVGAFWEKFAREWVTFAEEGRRIVLEPFVYLFFIDYGKKELKILEFITPAEMGAYLKTNHPDFFASGSSPAIEIKKSNQRIRKSSFSSIINLPFISVSVIFLRSLPSAEMIVLISGGCMRIRMIPEKSVGLYRSTLEKWISWVRSTRFSFRHSSAIKPFLHPDGGRLTLWPKDDKKESTLISMFSSMRKCIASIEGDKLLALNHFSSKVEDCLDVIFGELRIALEYFFWCFASLKEFQDDIRKNSGAPEYRLAMTNLWVYRYIFRKIIQIIYLPCDKYTLGREIRQVVIIEAAVASPIESETGGIISSPMGLSGKRLSSMIVPNRASSIEHQNAVFPRITPARRR